MRIKIYRDSFGYSPFEEWLKNLKDKNLTARILVRIDRIEEGNLGDHKFLCYGISELRFNFSSGIRIYYGRDGNELVVLLIAGNKKTQSRDIQKALGYFKDYLRIRNEI